MTEKAPGPAAKLPVLFFWLGCLALLSSCTLTPQYHDELRDSLASRPDIRVSIVQGGEFDLLAIAHRTTSQRARLYLEGDGRPWLAGGTRVSEDPTPRNPLVRRWMLQDPGPALYLGRPCYFGLGPTPPCHPALWTFSRYSEEVLDALVEAAETWLDANETIESLTLVGHSGGGVLALLLAEHLARADRVLALATPVDTEAWADLHGHTRLFDSLNPAAQANWREGVERVFLFGADDKTVPPHNFVEAALAIPGSQVITVPGEGHLCCAPQRALTATSR
ncbi:hypothetical protein FEI13_03015 [Halomonas urmiana]|uniref:Alpha/beta hydrolase n=1 Tax=Halomonas urmiana TaxID=490901 RepID=A0A5R8MLM8_9GAMM|nr:hypothetical protein [Halomonas urmiana]TLF53085.1 hypothetical protein FEI13_03015 [Halomonas urmiana]